MPYTVPTAEQLKARFPPLSDLDDPYVDAVISEAARFVDETWFEADYQPAIMFLAAHMLVSEGALGGEVNSSGLVTAEKLGDASVSYGNAVDPSKSISDYGSTAYGRRFQQLLRVNQSGPITV